MKKDTLLYDTIRPIQWHNNCLRLLDQRKLPEKEVYLDINTTQGLVCAIKKMVVRGAPAIGVAAAFGVVLAAKEALKEDAANFKPLFHTKLNIIAKARPTAINLLNAVNAAKKLVESDLSDEPVPCLLNWAKRWLIDDITANKAIGAFGSALISSPSNILTHCNAGALATAGYGTALGVIRSSHENGLIKKLYAAETRPWNQGARLTAWELNKDSIPATLIADSAAALLMHRGLIDWIIVGADSIALNGDVVNKIGTYSLAVLAKQHNVKLMVAAPQTTFDKSASSGESVVIEERRADELLPAYYDNNATIDAWNPVFDITPAKLIDAIVTEKGVLKSPDARKMSDFMGDC